MRLLLQPPKRPSASIAPSAAPPEAKPLHPSAAKQGIVPLPPSIANISAQRLLQPYGAPSIPVLGAAPGTPQAKLTLSSPGDAQEQQADRVADQVMRMPAQPSERSTPGQDSLLPAACPACEQLVQREATPAAGASSPGLGAPAGLAGVGQGQPLPVSTRRFFEPRFGCDFANVRVHADAEAARSAAGLQAKAYTLGHDIVFAADAYQPASVEGQRLLAHELTHVMQQQTASTAPVVQRLADPRCDSASRLPYGGGCTGFVHTCYSDSFTAASGTGISVSVTVNYATSDCSFSTEDFRVELYQCGWFNSTVQDFGVTPIGGTLVATATLPGAGIVVGNDHYYLRIYSRSHCDLNASISVT